MTFPLDLLRRARTHDSRPTDAASRASTDLDDLLGGRRLLLVSNREPYVRKRDEDGTRRFERTAGGLVTALDPVMRRSGGVWVAWEPSGKAGSDTRHQVPNEAPRFTLRQVPLSVGEVRDYYYGFANRALWPLAHYFMDQCHFDETEWRQYVKVNSRFADAVIDESTDDDLIWIHDYHFCLLPEMIRERRVGGGPIAYFLHIPFPTEEVFRILPWRRQLLRGLLGADLVGFHVRSYAEHFLRCCQSLLGAEVDMEAGRVMWQGREVEVGAFPIGIDVDAFEEIARLPATRRRARELRRSLGEPMILGVDRMDYSKGIPARLAAIDSLLDHHPEHCGKFTFVQVAVPSRTKVKEYQELKSEIDELIGRINGRYGDAEWQPIRYVYRGLPRDELVAHYLAADVALLTPLRDGMNLVAKEYCASKVEGAAGVLVLSEFTGAAQELGEELLVVNPFAVEEMAEALHQALVMPERERRRRMASLRAKVREGDISHWVESILRRVTRDHGRVSAGVGAGEGGRPS